MNLNELSDKFSNSLLNNNLEEFKLLFSQKNLNIFLDLNGQNLINSAATYDCFDILNIILKDERIKVTNRVTPIINSASKDNILVLELLINDGRFNPSASSNYAIINAYETSDIKKLEDVYIEYNITINNKLVNDIHNKKIDMIDMLWKNGKIKKTLENDHFELFNIMKQKDIKNNIKSF